MIRGSYAAGKGPASGGKETVNRQRTREPVFPGGKRPGRTAVHNREYGREEEVAK